MGNDNDSRIENIAGLLEAGKQAITILWEECEETASKMDVEQALEVVLLCMDNVNKPVDLDCCLEPTPLIAFVEMEELEKTLKGMAND